MSAGYVYILTNPSMPGLVKIGKTTREVEGRMSELYQTGVPQPFELAHSVYCVDCGEIEQWMHEKFSSLRRNCSREFFDCDASVAARALDEMLLEQVKFCVSGFLPDHVPVRTEFCMDEAMLCVLAGELDCSSFEVADAINSLSACEIKPAVERVIMRSRERAEKRRLKLVAGS